MRATRYFRLFKRYGGLPIIREIQSTLNTDSTLLAVPRESTQNTYKFMIEDCVYAGENLPTRWSEEANDWGRITSGAGYALAGIIANYYASPIFNRADNASRWTEAYELNKKALEKLAEGNFGLAYEGNPGINASNWAAIWCNMTSGNGLVSEAVYTEICNNVVEDHGLYNCWEQSIRPVNANGGGGISPSAEEVDMFPMADGKRPAEAGNFIYDKKLFFLNRDPRFYRTFAFPGEEWKYNGTVSADKVPTQCPYISGLNYQLMNFAWYPSANDAKDPIQTGYFTDLLGTKGSSVYVRKKSQDYDLNSTPLYIFQNDGGFKLNGQPLVAIRYAEVLLNFAEAACGANHLDEAWNVLIRIRQRVGYTGDCGLDPAIKGDRARMFEAILYERRIELAYEGKRFDDCHRWMLFDGGVGQEQIYSGWTMSGWNGNTCAYLGVKPLNGTSLHKIELHFDPALYTAAKSSTVKNPFDSLKIARPTALTLKENMTTTQTVDTDGNIQHTISDVNVKALVTFYNKYLIRKDVVTMTNGTAHWSKNCYLMGLHTSDQSANPKVVQTVGWIDAFGGTGVFDPLSDNPVTSIGDESAAAAVVQNHRKR
ncbi:MAG: RagB/SusD family nutrient uptake outer membrane protein [Paludibacter sp.]